ncbi:NAD(P)-binding domain-containing protein [Paraburkholderia sp. CNPSo 3076]|uniref:NAD(P)-binding domain-containing protein n=1 Tax=Paraburkholderia sp. CNPSo 3076 TaxID=2940936 RepID=UPI00225BF173|nr:NAD(P)-binding domain-containing protein [Paraburkholderia sp. CNPSo 3076]MCX5545330.1 NAD(P)-binding domain-containing protein [Paraburkholderia sp. CNPSo 3076]
MQFQALDTVMKIGFIGAGLIGGGLARLAVQAGHEVIVSNSRDPRTLFSVVAGGSRPRRQRS